MSSTTSTTRHFPTQPIRLRLHPDSELEDINDHRGDEQGDDEDDVASSSGDDYYGDWRLTGTSAGEEELKGHRSGRYTPSEAGGDEIPGVRMVAATGRGRTPERPTIPVPPRKATPTMPRAKAMARKLGMSTRNGNELERAVNPKASSLQSTFKENSEGRDTVPSHRRRNGAFSGKMPAPALPPPPPPPTLPPIPSLHPRTADGMLQGMQRQPPRPLPTRPRQSLPAESSSPPPIRHSLPLPLPFSSTTSTSTPASAAISTSTSSSMFAIVTTDSAVGNILTPALVRALAKQEGKEKPAFFRRTLPPPPSLSTAIEPTSTSPLASIIYTPPTLPSSEPAIEPMSPLSSLPSTPTPTQARASSLEIPSVQPRGESQQGDPLDPLEALPCKFRRKARKLNIAAADMLVIETTGTAIELTERRKGTGDVVGGVGVAEVNVNANEDGEIRAGRVERQTPNAMKPISSISQIQPPAPSAQVRFKKIPGHELNGIGNGYEGTGRRMFVFGRGDGKGNEKEKEKEFGDGVRVDGEKERETPKGKEKENLREM